MTFRVYKSQIGDNDFPAAVEEYRQALLANRLIGNATPHTHHMIEACVARVPREGEMDDYVADYEIIDDIPPPPSGEEIELVKRAALLVKLHEAERAALDGVMGAGKLRLLSLQCVPVHAKGADEHTEAEKALVASLRDVMTRQYEIQLHSATAHAHIDELPADQLDGHEWAPFPK